MGRVLSGNHKEFTDRIDKENNLSGKMARFPDKTTILNCAPKVGHNKFKHERIKVSN